MKSKLRGTVRTILPNGKIRIHRARKRPTKLAPARDALSVPDVAREIRTSPDTIREWVKRGELKAANLATGSRPRYVIQRSDLTAFLKSRQQQPKAPPRRSRKIVTKSTRFS